MQRWWSLMSEGDSDTFEEAFTDSLYSLHFSSLPTVNVLNICRWVGAGRVFDWFDLFDERVSARSKCCSLNGSKWFLIFTVTTSSSLRDKMTHSKVRIYVFHRPSLFPSPPPVLPYPPSCPLIPIPHCLRASLFFSLVLSLSINNSVPCLSVERTLIRAWFIHFHYRNGLAWEYS